MSVATSRLVAQCRRIHPVKILVLGYLSYLLVGWALLCVPAMQDAPGGLSALDNLFTATSAMSTTGLITVDQPRVYSFWGELVILLLIQLGGLGYMTFGSFVVLAGRPRLSEWREGMTRTAFVMPAGFRPAAFIRSVVLFTLAVEVVGAALLFWAFSSAGVAERAALTGDADIGASFSGWAHVAWQSVFHSISAFCTAGFSLFPDSLAAYRDNPWINMITSALSLFGAIGFIVMADVFWTLTGRRRHLTLTTKVILKFTFWILVLGTALLFLAEPALRDLPAESRLMAAFFQAMTAATTVGFNTVDIGALSAASVLLMYGLMIIGASPSGTGGGLKSTSLSAIFATVRSTLRGQHEVHFAGRLIPRDRLHTAYAALGFYVFTLAVGGYLLLLTESRPDAIRADAVRPLQDLLFEAASALGTVGISRGVTGELSDLGKWVIIGLMFIGRVGPLTFGLALFAGAPVAAGAADEKEEDIAV